MEDWLIYLLSRTLFGPIFCILIGTLFLFSSYNDFKKRVDRKRRTGIFLAVRALVAGFGFIVTGTYFLVKYFL